MAFSTRVKSEEYWHTFHSGVIFVPGVTVSGATGIYLSKDIVYASEIEPICVYVEKPHDP